MLHFPPVPPSKRQAAGPLTENLPNVCLVNELPALPGSFRCYATKASRKQSLHQGTISRLSSREVYLNQQRSVERGLAKGSSWLEIAAKNERIKGTSC